jgi:hypothetical protein
LFTAFKTTEFKFCLVDIIINNLAITISFTCSPPSTRPPNPPHQFIKQLLAYFIDGSEMSMTSFDRRKHDKSYAAVLENRSKEMYRVLFFRIG